MKRYLSSVILALFAVTCAVAQDYAIELQPDKKVVYVDRLGLAENTPIVEVLRMFPELVVREDYEYLSGYDVFLDSKSVAYNKDLLLETMKVYEVEKIEISISPTASQQVNGMAGSIKIISRAMPDGVSGSATAEVNTLWDITPNMNLNYRTDKLELRGNVGLDLYSGKKSYYTEQVLPERYESINDTISEKLFQETARLYMKYNPTKKDQLKVWVLESFQTDKRVDSLDGIRAVPLPDQGKYIYRVTESGGTEYMRLSNLNFSAFAEYEHRFKDEMKFVLSADYIRDSKRSGTTSLDGVPPETPQDLKSEAKFVLPLLPAGGKILNLTLGGNIQLGLHDKEKIENRSLYASPFAELKYDSPKLKINSGLRYQYYEFIYDKSRREMFEKGLKNFTFNVNALWQIADHHALRFFVTKNIIRPSSEQMYPVFEWDMKRSSYVSGNKDLRPATMYSFDLNYITDWNIGSHRFVTDASFGYDRADGLVNMVRRYDEEKHKSFLTYENLGVNDILKAKAELLYSYGIFSVSLAGNWYYNMKRDSDGKDNINNFNIGLSPVFSFNNDWTLSGTFRYNDAISGKYKQIGNCFYSCLRVSRTFGRWIVNALLSDIFGYVSEDYELGDGGYYYTRYDQYPRGISLGVTYRIGR